MVRGDADALQHILVLARHIINERRDGVQLAELVAIAIPLAAISYRQGQIRAQILVVLKTGGERVRRSISDPRARTFNRRRKAERQVERELLRGKNQDADSTATLIVSSTYLKRKKKVSK